MLHCAKSQKNVNNYDKRVPENHAIFRQNGRTGTCIANFGPVISPLINDLSAHRLRVDRVLSFPTNAPFGSHRGRPDGTGEGVRARVGRDLILQGIRIDSLSTPYEMRACNEDCVQADAWHTTVEHAEPEQLPILAGE
jgi:hypothetical protein